jgi:hypothetical protein
MDTALALFLTLLAALAAFDGAAFLFGVDSRDTATDDHGR